MMKNSVHSKLMGQLIYNESYPAYERTIGKINWKLDAQETADVTVLIQKAEKLFVCLEDFDKKAKACIAEKLIAYKNDCWPEYDENDEDLNWEAVDNGLYDITEREFAEALTLHDIVIKTESIYCEYLDGDLFGGHRVHACFDDHYSLLEATI